MKKSKIKLPLRKNYLVIIENSKGAKIFQDCFGKNRKIKNLTEKRSFILCVEKEVCFCGKKKMDIIIWDFILVDKKQFLTIFKRKPSGFTTSLITGKEKLRRFFGIKNSIVLKLY